MKGRTGTHVNTIGPRPARPVVPIRNQADELLREHAAAFARLVQAILATAPDEHLVRTLTRVYNEAAGRLAGDDDLTAVMDAVFEPTTAPRLLALAGGA